MKKEKELFPLDQLKGHDKIAEIRIILYQEKSRFTSGKKVPKISIDTCAQGTGQAILTALDRAKDEVLSQILISEGPQLKSVKE